jgi:hypothetical protein
MSDGIPAFLRLPAEQRRAAWVGRKLTDPNKPEGKHRPWGYPKSMSDAEVRAAERERIKMEKDEQAKRLAALRARRER